MKHIHKFVVATTAIALVGCGGTGGTGNVASTSQVTQVLNSTPRVEAIVAVLRTNLNHPNQWTDQQLVDPTNMDVYNDLKDNTVFGVADPTNIQVGEQYIFQVVNYSQDSSGHLKRNILTNGVSFTNSDSDSNYGVLATNTGQYNAGAFATASPLYVTATYKGVSYAAEYDIRTRQVRQLGMVNPAAAGAPSLAGSKVQFYDGTGALVDTAVVQYDGTFRASIPINTVSFTINGDSLPKDYYRSFNFQPANQAASPAVTYTYDASVVTCFAPIPVANPTSGLIPGTNGIQMAITVPPRVAGSSAPASTGCTNG